MGLTTVQTFALIFSLLFIIKFIFILFNKRAWIKFAKRVYTNKSMAWLFGVLALIVLYYLLQAMSIADILAAGLFIALLMGMAFAAYGKEFIKMGEKMLKTSIPAAVWINMIIWLVLSIWAVYLMFF